MCATPPNSPSPFPCPPPLLEVLPLPFYHLPLRHTPAPRSPPRWCCVTRTALTQASTHPHAPPHPPCSCLGGAAASPRRSSVLTLPRRLAQFPLLLFFGCMVCVVCADGFLVLLLLLCLLAVRSCYARGFGGPAPAPFESVSCSVAGVPCSCSRPTYFCSCVVAPGSLLSLVCPWVEWACFACSPTVLYRFFKPWSLFPFFLSFIRPRPSRFFPSCTHSA